MLSCYFPLWEMWKTAAPPMENRYSRPDGKTASFPTARKHCFPQLRPSDRLRTVPQRLLLLRNIQQYISNRATLKKTRDARLYFWIVYWGSKLEEVDGCTPNVPIGIMYTATPYHDFHTSKSIRLKRKSQTKATKGKHRCLITANYITQDNTLQEIVLSFYIRFLFLWLYSHHAIPDPNMGLDILRRTRLFFQFLTQRSHKYAK